MEDTVQQHSVDMSVGILAFLKGHPLLSAIIALFPMGVDYSMSWINPFLSIELPIWLEWVIGMCKGVSIVAGSGVVSLVLVLKFLELMEKLKKKK